MGKKNNYELTDQDRIDIAELALTGLDLSEEIKSTLARNFVSKSFFNQQIRQLMLSLGNNKGRAMTAGISGKEMIEEINKVLGTDWQSQATSLPPSTQVNVRTENYILAAADQTVELDNGGNDRSITIPLQSVVTFTAGRIYEFRRTGTGELSIVKGGAMIFEAAIGDANFKVDAWPPFPRVFPVFAENIGIDHWKFTGTLKPF